MVEINKLPLLPLRGLLVFPYMIVHIDVKRERSVAAIEAAMAQDNHIMLCAQKNEETDLPKYIGKPDKDEVFLCMMLKTQCAKGIILGL